MKITTFPTVCMLFTDYTVTKYRPLRSESQISKGK